MEQKSDNDIDIELQIHFENESKESSKKEKPEKTIVKYDNREIYLLFKRFKRLHRDAGRLLNQSHQTSRISLIIKLSIVVLGLVTSYVSAISGIEETRKTYITTIFSLGSALLSGLTSVKNFSRDSSKYYSGYMDYLELATKIEPIFYNFEGDVPYKNLVADIDKVITKYEGMINKTKQQLLTHAEKRPKVFENLIYDKIKANNGGKFPEWLEHQLKVELNDDKDIRKIIGNEEHFVEDKKI
jgi:hypothetical protein